MEFLENLPRTDVVNGLILLTMAAIFVMGLDFGAEIIKQYSELQAVFVCQNNHIYISQGLRNRFLLHHNTQYRCFVI